MVRSLAPTLLILTLFGTGPTLHAQQVIDIKNPSFEQGLSEWNAEADNGMSAAVPEAAREGKLGLRVTDDNPKTGSSLYSASFPVTAGKIYQLRFSARMISGDGIGVYIAFYNAGGKSLIARKEDELQYKLDPLSLPKNQTDWKEFLLRKTAPDSAVEGRIWIHSYNSMQAVADFDDFHLVELPQS